MIRATASATAAARIDGIGWAWGHPRPASRLWIALRGDLGRVERGSGHGTTPAGGRAGAVRALGPGGREPGALLDRGGPDVHIVYPNRYGVQSGQANGRHARHTTTRTAQCGLARPVCLLSPVMTHPMTTVVTPTFRTPATRPGVLGGGSSLRAPVSGR
jgi:hypothetical protein